MKLAHLRGFLEVVQCGTVTAAANRLGVSQPALSVQIRALEKTLGQPLFRRGAGRLQLTEAGQLLQERAPTILAMVERTIEEIAALERLEGGRLRLGIAEHLALDVLAPLVPGFARRFPGIDLRLTTAHTATLAALLEKRELDLAIVTLPLSVPALEIETLFWREDVAVLHPGNRLAGRAQISPGALVAEPFWLLEEGSHSRLALLRFLEEQGHRLRDPRPVASVCLILEMVAQGQGVGIVPAYAALAPAREGRVTALRLSGLPVRGVGVATRAGEGLGPAGRAFVALIRERVPDIWELRPTAVA